MPPTKPVSVSSMLPMGGYNPTSFRRLRRSVARVFWHCSASDNAAHDNVATVTRWHKERGWATVGYHFFIRKDGTIERGRDLELAPAAQAGHNAGTIAICLHGLDERKFTVAQFAAARALATAINDAYAGALSHHGHREVAAKACPVFDYKAVLELDRLGKSKLRSTRPAPAVPSRLAAINDNLVSNFITLRAA